MNGQELPAGTGIGTALVTGGGRRVGAAIVRDLAAHGFAVAIHCNHSLRDATELAATLRDQGARITVLQADLVESAARERLVEEAADALGGLDLLVNNASVFRDDRADAPDPDIWRQSLAIHLEAPVALTGAFSRALPADRTGMVVNVIDQRIWRLNPRFFSYTLSKSALWTATQTMAQALAPRIRVNAIGPGPTFASERQSPQDFARQQQAVPLRRGPDPAEFGRTIRWLWSCPSVTGQMIALDGGQHLAWQTPDVADMRE